MPQIVVKKVKKEIQEKSLFIAVSKAAVPSAVKRNLLKRRIRAIIRPFVERGGNNFFVVVKKGADMVSFEDLKREIVKAINHQ